MKGDITELQRSLANGTDVNAADYDSRTALHLAASEGRVDVVKFLLAQGANINCKDRLGGTALMDALRHNHIDCQRLLVNAGATLEGMEFAIKMCEAAAAGALPTIKVLIEAGIDPNIADYDKRTPLHLASSNNRLSIIEYLKENAPELNVNAIDRMGGTPLDDSIRHKHEVVQVLLRSMGGKHGNDDEVKKSQETLEVLRAVKDKSSKRAAISQLLVGTREKKIADNTETALAHITRVLPSLEHIPATCKDRVVSTFESVRAFLDGYHTDTIAFFMHTLPGSWWKGDQRKPQSFYGDADWAFVRQEIGELPDLLEECLDTKGSAAVLNTMSPEIHRCLMDMKELLAIQQQAEKAIRKVEEILHKPSQAKIQAMPPKNTKSESKLRGKLPSHTDSPNDSAMKDVSDKTEGISSHPGDTKVAEGGGPDHDDTATQPTLQS